MATLLEKTEFINGLSDSFKSVKLTGERIIGLIQAAKQTVTTDKASIASTAILDATEKTETTDEYTADNQVKADILAEFGLQAMALIDNIISYYKLDTNNSTQPDSHGSNDGTVNGGATYTASGKVNGAYDFNGSTGYIDITGLVATAAVYSITVWIKTSSAANQYIFDSATGRLVLIVNTTFQIYDGGFRDSSITVNDGAWHFCSCTRDGAAYTLGVDGSYVSGTGAGKGLNGTTHIGADKNGTSAFFDGIIDEMGVWDRRLSEAETTELYSSGSGLRYPFTGGGIFAPYYYEKLMQGQV